MIFSPCIRSTSHFNLVVTKDDNRIVYFIYIYFLVGNYILRSKHKGISTCVILGQHFKIQSLDDLFSSVLKFFTFHSGTKNLTF